MAVPKSLATKSVETKVFCPKQTQYPGRKEQKSPTEQEGNRRIEGKHDSVTHFILLSKMRKSLTLGNIQ
jgi:hypothetical protein